MTDASAHSELPGARAGIRLKLVLTAIGVAAAVGMFVLIGRMARPDVFTEAWRPAQTITSSIVLIGLLLVPAAVRRDRRGSAPPRPDR